MTNQSENKGDPNRHKGSEKKSFIETFESLKKHEKFESFLGYAQSHTQDTIAYILLVIGLIWMYFNWFYGGVLVGLVAGFYFSKELLHVLTSFNEFLEEQGIAKTLILGGTLLALFFSVPGIFFGVAIILGIKQMMK